MNKLDVVIPNLNYDGYQIGIDSLRRNTPEGVINKIIFINQSGVDVKNVDIEVRVDNIGFAKSMNTGIRLSDAPFVMCANDDVVWFNKKWWEGIEQTFNDYSTALCVNPSSVCDPDGAGGTQVMQGFEYKEDYSDEEYEKLLNPTVIDGICMWSPVFKRDMLDKVKGIVPGKAWFNEAFRYGGGDDYAMNWHAYRSGMRCLGTGKSYVWHWWHKTRNPNNVDGKLGAHYDPTWETMYSRWEDGKITERPGIFGEGREDIPTIIVRD